MGGVRLGLGFLLLALVSVSCAGGQAAVPADNGQPTRAEATSTPASSTATPSPTPTATPTPEPVSTVGIVCGGPGVSDFDLHTITLAPDGSPDYEALWALHLTCDQGYLGRALVVERVPVVTPLQMAVVEAAQLANYGEYHDNEAEILYAVYEQCGSNDPDHSYVTLEDYSEAQVKELQAWMTLCPTHPQAARWEQGIAASVVAQEAEASGARVYDGTYEVPSQMQRGSFIVRDVENCYWETRDGNGRIIDNNFVVAAPRVVANVSAEAVVFTARGCGQWNKE